MVLWSFFPLCKLHHRNVKMVLWMVHTKRFWYRYWLQDSLGKFASPFVQCERALTNVINQHEDRCRLLWTKEHRYSPSHPLNHFTYHTLRSSRTNTSTTDNRHQHLFNANSRSHEFLLQYERRLKPISFRRRKRCRNRLVCISPLKLHFCLLSTLPVYYWTVMSWINYS